jgi:hypothetical protein
MPRFRRAAGYAAGPVAASGPGITVLAGGALTVISMLPASPRIAGSRAR